MEVPRDVAIETGHGRYIVRAIDRFAVGGSLDAEVTAAVAGHAARYGAPPKAVIWDDAVLGFRPYNLSLNLTRIFVPPNDPYVAARLDSSARAAIRRDCLPETADGAETALGHFAWPLEVAHAPGLIRMIGWPAMAPVRATREARPARQAGSISVVINYRDKADTTIACLHRLRRQQITATLEIILVDNQSTMAERRAVEAAADKRFGEDPRVAIRHLRYDADFNHSAQCNRAAAAASGDVLVMMSNDCNLIDVDALQTLADWALEPGVGIVGPRLLGDDGLAACAGIAVGPRSLIAPEPKIHEAEVDYLSAMVRRSNGASFACAAIARDTWRRMGGADAAAFPIDYNDADFSLRLTETGFANMYAGTVRAHHHPGLTDSRTKASGEALHAELIRRHPLTEFPRLNPYALPIKTYPPFAVGAGNVICDYVRLYRLALDLRNSATEPLPPALVEAFNALAAIARPEPSDNPLRYTARLDAAIRDVCAACLASAPVERVPDRYRKSFTRLEAAFGTLARMAGQTDGAAPAPSSPARESPEAPPPEETPAATAVFAEDPDPAKEFLSHTDARFADAEHRLLVFADAMGPSQQIMFLEGLGAARAAGNAAVRILSEDDLLRLRSLRGPERLAALLRETLAHLRPTAVIFSRFAEQHCYREIGAALAEQPPGAIVLQLDDDFFSLPAVTGIDRFREARHPRRIHCLSMIAADADIILAATPILAGRLAALFGAHKVNCCPMHVGATPPESAASGREPTIGYYGSATHNRDLGVIAPVLRKLKAERPALRIEIVGSVARRSITAGLGNLVVARPELEHDYARFRRSMRTWNWTIGLAPLLSHPFNAAKTPIKWTEYAQAGIPMIASRAEPYLDLGRDGALLLASRDEWYNAIIQLLDRPALRAELLATSIRMIATFDGWRGMERRLLGLLDRAARRRNLFKNAA